MDKTIERTETLARTRVGDVIALALSFARSYYFPIVLFAVWRVWTLIWASAASVFAVPSPAAMRLYHGSEPLRDLVFAPWQRWDTIWYVKIAMEGYLVDERLVFAPLYPLLMRLFSPLTGNNFVATGLLISSVASLTSFILLYRLGRELFDEGSARRTLLFLVAFPTAFFLLAAYTEAFFLALALGSLVCARGKRWEWAGVLGGLAALTRPQGVLFLFVLGVEFWSQYRSRQVPLSKSWPLLLVALGGVGHLLWLTIQFGTPLIWFQAQAVWHRSVMPWESLGAGWREVFLAPSLHYAAIGLLDPLLAVIFLCGLVWSWRRLPLSMTIYMAIIVIPALFVMTTYAERFPMIAVSRYVIVGFPFFLLLGSCQKSWWQLPLLSISFLWQTVWLVLFVAWVFVR